MAFYFNEKNGTKRRFKKLTWGSHSHCSNQSSTGSVSIGKFTFCLALYRNIRQRTITNMYLLSLAMADLMMAIFVFPSLLVASGLSRWSFSQSFCQFTGLLTTFWAEFSLCILAITAINRYFCVMKPQWYAPFSLKKIHLTDIFGLDFPMCF